MGKICFDLVAGERVRVGKPPRLAPHLPAEPTVQGDIRIPELKNSVGRKNAHGNTPWVKKMEKSAFTRSILWLIMWVRKSVMSELITFRKRAGYMEKGMV